MSGWIWVVPIVLAAMAYGYFMHRSSRTKLEPLFESMASELEGRAKSGGFIAQPRIQFCENPMIEISVMPGGGTRAPRGDITYARIRYAPMPPAGSDVRQSAREFSLRIARKQPSVQDLLDSKLMPEVLIGDPDFERDFLIRTQRPEIARHLLTSEIKLDLAGYERSATLVVQFTAGECVVSTSGIAESKHEIRRLAKSSALLREQILGVLGTL